jgi:hypothetical protein
MDLREVSSEDGRHLEPTVAGLVGSSGEPFQTVKYKHGEALHLKPYVGKPCYVLEEPAGV